MLQLGGFIEPILTQHREDVIFNNFHHPSIAALGLPAKIAVTDTESPSQ